MGRSPESIERRRAANREYHRAGRRKLTPEQKARRDQRSKEWAKAHPERVALRNKRYREAAKVDQHKYLTLKKGNFAKVGVQTSVVELNAMWERCAGRCEQCQRELLLQTDKKGNCAHFDHDHKTLQMRRVLCIRCNHAQSFVDSGLVVWRVAPSPG